MTEDRPVMVTSGPEKRLIRVISIGVAADHAEQLMTASMRRSDHAGGRLEVLGDVRSFSDFLAMGPHLLVNLVLWKAPSRYDDEAVRCLQQLLRIRPRTGVLILLDDERKGEAGPWTAGLHERRRRGEIPPAWVTTRRDFRVTLTRALAELGFAAPEISERPSRPVVLHADSAPGSKVGRFSVVDLMAARPEGDPADKSSPPDTARAQVVLCLGPKGGVGKTTIAVSLAVLAAQIFPDPVTLIDLDLTSPDVTVHLDAFNGPDIIDLLPHLAVDDRREPLQFFQPGRLPLRLVSAPHRPELAELVNKHHVARLIKDLKNESGVVVIDTPAGFGDEVIFEALSLTDWVVVVTTPDPTAVRQTALALEFLDRLDICQPQRRLLVLNQAHRSGLIGTGRIERFLEQSIDVEIPLDRSVCDQAIAGARPVVLMDPYHPVSGALKQLAVCLGWPVPVVVHASLSSVWLQRLRTAFRVGGGR